MNPQDTPTRRTARRALLALAVVFLMLATSGWTSVHRAPSPGLPVQSAYADWDRDHLGRLRLPAHDSSPRALTRFFASLGEKQRARLAHRHPLAVGNMDGAPPELRYLANRLSLEKARRVEKRRIDDPRLSPDGRHEAGRRMHRFESMLTPGRQFLSFDPQGGGRAAEVFGDLGSAERISVVVPGVDTDLLSFQRTVGKYTAVSGMAEALHSAEHRTRPGVRTAVIAWADYTAPSGLGMEAATAGRAADGSVRLRSMIGALPGRSPVALYCHSYGSVLCGIAAPELPQRVSDLAVAGSPGMRVPNAPALHTEARVWATRNTDDWIGDVPFLEVGGIGHGADPVSDSFGARRVSADGSDGHADYFLPGTQSLRNFAAIGTGAYEQVRCAAQDDACRTGLPAENASRPV